MKKFIIPFCIFLIIFLIYFTVATQFTFKPKWAVDYFNPLARSLLNFRLNIQTPGMTYDLVNYKEKWYVPWGIIASIFLIPIQLIRGRFVPILYLSLFFSSLNVVIVYLLLNRIKKEFLPKISTFAIYIFLILFAFGTTHFYVGTLGSVWHVNQMVTSFLGTLGIYIIFKKNRTIKDYLLCSIVLSAALLGRFTIVMLLILPVFLYVSERFSVIRHPEFSSGSKFIKDFFLVFGLPLLFFLILSFSYNYLRFGNPFEFGYSYIHEAPGLAKIREENGLSSFKNFTRNARLMLFEIPGISFSDKFHFNFNLNGNSIFFLTPPFLTAFLVRPRNRYIIGLWIAGIFTIIPSLLHYSSGWMQFGYRYSLDITVLLLLLSVFGIKGKLNLFYTLGVVFSVVIYFWGINSLM